ncbi:PDZ domain-containing protein [Thermodesulfovibrio yellowstonii]|uniref:PDZ domain-containing protein n=1 Tax=Thermodesulfovibrio yellowstonii TaxID=28262 RepID=UPI0024B3A9C0|nr:PDZ domain-containing protein [Thermodesulfovibrio yellowstonii]MDI6865976.1 PDZ domain-containing protein [Thermodesulfovibrio yellowstonii]
MKKFFISVMLLCLVEFAYAQSEIEKYRCIEVRTDLVDDKIQYSIKRENSVEFILKNCLPESLKIHVGDKKFTYEKSKILVEDGRIEKNDLFAFECYQPFFEEDLYHYRITNQAEYIKYLNSRNYRFHLGKITPLITPDYSLYPTLKQTAEKVNLETPHRTFVILNRSGGASHEFFCYIDESHAKKPLQDKCLYSFDQVLDIHMKNNDAVAIKALAEKYLKRLDYEKAEKAYKKLMELSNNEDYEGLLSFYITTNQYRKAEEILLKKIDESPYDARLYISLANLYLHKSEYDRAKLFITKALKLGFEEGEYKAYGILGEVYIAERNFKGAILSFKKASELFKKECEQQKLLMDFFKKDTEIVDCELQALPYELKTIYSLTELEDFIEAEKMAKEILSKKQDNPYIFGHLSFIYAGTGDFEKAIDASDKAISLLKRKGIGANIVMGEIYPVVVSVDRNTPSEKAGLKRGDRIINIRDRDLRLYRESKDIIQMLVDYISSNDTVKLTIHRDNSTDLKKIELKPEEFLKPEASQALAFKAIILRVKGNYPEFENLTTKAYELNPEDKLAEIAMALLKTDTGSFNEALEFLEKAGKDVHGSLILLIRPLVYAKAGQVNKAKELYREIPEELLKTKNTLYRVLLDEIKRVLHDKQLN